jgi:hypothetical protein
MNSDEKFASDSDLDVGKKIKRFRYNPIGHNVYLLPCGSVVKDEDKIIMAQRIWLHNYYKPGGRGAMRILERL